MPSPMLPSPMTPTVTFVSVDIERSLLESNALCWFGDGERSHLRPGTDSLGVGNDALRVEQRSIQSLKAAISTARWLARRSTEAGSRRRDLTRRWALACDKSGSLSSTTPSAERVSSVVTA